MADMLSRWCRSQSGSDHLNRTFTFPFIQNFYTTYSTCLPSLVSPCLHASLWPPGGTPPGPPPPLSSTPPPPSRTSTLLPSSLELEPPPPLSSTPPPPSR